MYNKKETWKSSIHHSPFSYCPWYKLSGKKKLHNYCFQSLLFITVVPVKKKKQPVQVVRVNKKRTIRQCLCKFFLGKQSLFVNGSWAMNRVALSARDESHVHTPLGRGCERRLRTTQTLDRHISIGFGWFLCVWTCVRTVAEVNEWERGLEPTKTELSINHFSVNAFFQLCAVSGHTRWE